MHFQQMKKNKSQKSAKQKVCQRKSKKSWEKKYEMQKPFFFCL